MVLSTVPKRAKSEETLEKQKIEYFKEIDYKTSTIFKETMAKQNMRTLKNGKNEEMIMDSSGILNKGQDAMIISGKIYSLIEIDYLTDILKNKSIKNIATSQSELNVIYKKARKTLKYFMKRILLYRQFLKLDKEYKLNDYNPERNLENVIKILMRCKRIYDAQQDIMIILIMIQKRIEKVKSLKLMLEIKHPDRKELRKCYLDALKLSSRIHIKISSLQDFEKTLDRPFVFGGK